MKLSNYDYYLIENFRSANPMIDFTKLDLLLEVKKLIKIENLNIKVKEYEEPIFNPMDGTLYARFTSIINNGYYSLFVSPFGWYVRESTTYDNSKSLLEDESKVWRDYLLNIFGEAYALALEQYLSEHPDERVFKPRTY